MAQRKYLQTNSPWEPVVGYSRAVKVGPFITVSGTTALDPSGQLVGEGDVGRQTRQCLEILRGVLGHLGSRMEHVVRTRMYVTNIDHWAEVGRVHGEYFGKIRPTTSMVQVVRLIDPRMLIEIEADAIVTEEL
ncbi:MAG: RidA family protein [Candidatus Eisenbacteria bacterium]|nr:RidA family protein [Candidatus Eisenbacteria bacterium]MCC7140869.1 RidA family protein [Candidatus Eisenbacteria bacterium]